MRRAMTAGVGALLAGVAAPALAQDFCGGESAGGQWIGGDEASSDLSSSSDYLEQMALVLMGNDYVALFSVSQPTDVRLEAMGRGAGDPVLDLRDESGAIVASDDDSGGAGASRIETTLQPGRYCLSMAAYDGGAITGSVRAGRLEHASLTPGMDATLPTPDDGVTDDYYGDFVSCDVANIPDRIGSDTSIDADLDAGGATVTASADQVGIYAFTLDQPRAVTITAENESADPLITLYDEYGSYLNENDDFDGLNSRLDMTYPLAAGSYCVAVQALSDTSAPITITVSEYDAAAAQLGMYDRAEASPPLDGSYPVTDLGPLGARLRTDIQSTDTASWFQFQVTEPSFVVIEAVGGTMGDPMLVLYDDFGRELAYGDDMMTGLDAMVSAKVEPGTYLVATKQVSSGTSALTRILIERYVPAQ